MQHNEMGALSRGVKVQLRVIAALMIRDVLMRNGRHNIGFGWVLLEPMILCVGVMIVWTVAGAKAHGGEGLTAVEMVLTGYMPLTLWRHMTNKSICLFRQSTTLLYHRTITLFDILFAKLFLEFITTTIAFAFVWGVLFMAGMVPAINNVGLALVGWLMMGMLGFAGGSLFVYVTERWETAERFVQPSQYLMVPMSGCFFLMDWAPPWAREILLLNPMIHSFEVLRLGFFGPVVSFYYDLPYFFVCTFVFLYLGIVGVSRVRPWIQIS
jgi:capsular polysaccharide transport system permease protein